MRTSMLAKVVFFVVGPILFVACGGEPENAARPSDDTAPAASEERRPATTGPAAPPANQTTRVALPGLYSIMRGLEADMARISRGLWLESFDTVAAGAEGVANHPRVPPEEFQRISEVLGEEMSRFGGMDMEVHDLAVRLAETARRGDLEAVLSADAQLRSGCVRCHSAYRERLRAEIR